MSAFRPGTIPGRRPNYLHTAGCVHVQAVIYVPSTEGWDIGKGLNADTPDRDRRWCIRYGTIGDTPGGALWDVARSARTRVSSTGAERCSYGTGTDDARMERRLSVESRGQPLT